MLHPRTKRCHSTPLPHHNGQLSTNLLSASFSSWNFLPYFQSVNGRHAVEFTNIVGCEVYLTFGKDYKINIKVHYD